MVDTCFSRSGPGEKKLLTSICESGQKGGSRYEQNVSCSLKGPLMGCSPVICLFMKKINVVCVCHSFSSMSLVEFKKMRYCMISFLLTVVCHWAWCPIFWFQENLCCVEFQFQGPYIPKTGTGEGWSTNVGICEQMSACQQVLESESWGVSVSVHGCQWVFRATSEWSGVPEGVRARYVSVDFVCFHFSVTSFFEC